MLTAATALRDWKKKLFPGQADDTEIAVIRHSLYATPLRLVLGYY